MICSCCITPIHLALNNTTHDAMTLIQREASNIQISCQCCGWNHGRSPCRHPLSSVAFTWQWGQVTFEPLHIWSITRQPISHSSLEQNLQREVISFLAAGKSEGVAPSSWLKVGTFSFLPTLLTFCLSKDREEDGWICSTAFPGDFASYAEASWDFAVAV